jgi:hypothetical protein
LAKLLADGDRFVQAEVLRAVRKRRLSTRMIKALSVLPRSGGLLRPNIRLFLDVIKFYLKSHPELCREALRSLMAMNIAEPQVRTAIRRLLESL